MSVWMWKNWQRCINMRDKLDLPLYLFAKEPVAGKVKTRLASKLGHDQCARLAAQMLRQSAERVSLDWQGRMVLCVTPRTEASLFLEMQKRWQCESELQQGNNLGERMLHAMQHGIERVGAAVVMGCDVPYISGEILRKAFKEIAAGGNIIGPAEDGGFYLLGLNQLEPRLFEDIIWGGDQVLSGVMNNATRCGIEFSSLPTLRDIDLWDDLIWLAERDERYFEFVKDYFDSRIKKRFR